MPNEIKLISFDAGGTLLHPYPSVGEVYSRIMRKHDLDISPNKLQQGFHRAFNLVPRSSLKTNEDIEFTFWKSIVKETLRDFKQPNDFNALFDDLWYGFAKAEVWRTSDQCLDTLKTLKKLEIPCIILSNWDSRLSKIIQGLKLDPFFAHVFISSEVGYNKPARELFKHVENVCQVKGQQILHIGDHLKNDIEASRALNWQSLLYDPKEKHQKQNSITSLSEVCDFINALE